MYVEESVSLQLGVTIGIEEEKSICPDHCVNAKLWNQLLRGASKRWT
jgi:hypothetical protein